jgi:hypothetical protein
MGGTFSVIIACAFYRTVIAAQVRYGILRVNDNYRSGQGMLLLVESIF